MAFTVGTEAIAGFNYEIGLVSKTDNKNYQMKFLTNETLSDSQIRGAITSVCDVYVESIKKVTKFKRDYTNPSGVFSSARVCARYLVNGSYRMTDSIYFPELINNKSELDVQNALKTLLGSSAEIRAFVPKK